MTATFKEFKIDSSTTGASGTWDEQNAVTNTAVCCPFILYSLYNMSLFYHFNHFFFAHRIILRAFQTQA